MAGGGLAVVCQGCNQDVPRIESRYRGHRVFVDDKGGHWGYKYCPDCFVNRRRSSKSPINTQCVFCSTLTNCADDICKKCYGEIEKAEASMPRTKLRHCRLCKQGLSADRYFYCRECLDWQALDESGFENTTSRKRFKFDDNCAWKEDFLDSLYAKYSKV